MGFLIVPRFAMIFPSSIGAQIQFNYFFFSTPGYGHGDLLLACRMANRKVRLAHPSSPPQPTTTLPWVDVYLVLTAALHGTSLLDVPFGAHSDLLFSFVWLWFRLLFGNCALSWEVWNIRLLRCPWWGSFWLLCRNNPQTPERCLLFYPPPLPQ